MKFLLFICIVFCLLSLNVYSADEKHTTKAPTKAHTTTKAPTTTTKAPTTTTKAATTTTHAATTTTQAATTTTHAATTTTKAATTTSSLLATVESVSVIQITNPKLDVQCVDYVITVGSGGLLNLTKFIVAVPCVDLCTLLSSKLLTLNIPLNITGSLLNLPLVVNGFIGLDASTGACGIIVNVDLTPLIVNALDLVYLDICLDLSLVLNLGGLLNGVLNIVLGTVDTLLGNVLSPFQALIPDLCSFL